MKRGIGVIRRLWKNAFFFFTFPFVRNFVKDV